MNSRQKEILEIVNKSVRVQVTDLSSLIGVSGVTIRQDLNFLEKAGCLKRIHGAAVSIQGDDVDSRLGANFNLKLHLANQAATLVELNETVLIEGGSTNTLLAKILAERGDVTIITPSVYIAHQIRDFSAAVILLGGVYQHQSESLVGPLTKKYIGEVHFSTAFLGVDGYHQDTGFTSRDMMRAEIAEAIISKNRRNIVITDSSKFGKIFPSSIGKTSDISILVTDAAAPKEDIQRLKTEGIEVLYNISDCP